MVGGKWLILGHRGPGIRLRVWDFGGGGMLIYIKIAPTAVNGRGLVGLSCQPEVDEFDVKTQAKNGLGADGAHFFSRTISGSAGLGRALISPTEQTQRHG
jgi:hypothetical protein